MVAKGKALECFKCIATEPEDCKSGKCESWFGCFTRISKQESDGRARIVQRGCKLDTARDECTTEESANIKYDVCDCKKKTIATIKKLGRQAEHNANVPPRDVVLVVYALLKAVLQNCARFH